MILLACFKGTKLDEHQGKVNKWKGGQDQLGESWSADWIPRQDWYDEADYQLLRSLLWRQRED